LEPEIHIWIDRAEATWLEALHAHAEKLFRDKLLPSHDQNHHIRVWNLCKSLLSEIATFNSRMDPSLVEGVLIAALFHDLGMATSTREDHGKLSRENCKQWFRDSGLDLPDRYEEILRAIEEHDRKDEQIYRSFEPGTTPEILAILSVADDLEALGTIGIYRYAEIYLMRDIPLEELGTRILDNARLRFEKLAEGCRLCPRLLEEYQQQYDELAGFYRQYNLQLKKTSQTTLVRSGPLGVINYIRRHGLDKGELKSAGDDIMGYFKKLDYELEQARL
jgi:HD superfamily phosphodiesterase